MFIPAELPNFCDKLLLSVRAKFSKTKYVFCCMQLKSFVFSLPMEIEGAKIDTEVVSRTGFFEALRMKINHCPEGAKGIPELLLLEW